MSALMLCGPAPMRRDGGFGGHTMLRTSVTVRLVSGAALLSLALPAQPAAAVQPATAVQPVQERGSRIARADDFAVFGFSQSDVDQEDPQVYELDPDVTVRA